MNEAYQYNVEEIFDGTSVDGKNTFFTYVVDPNPLNNVSVGSEDLFIFVRLRAFPRNRSIITSDNVYSSNNQDKDGIYFITSTKQNNQGYLTTNYTNIGGIEGNIEGFGIKDISIESGMGTPPTVEITFIDVRGAAVFNNYDNFDEEGLRYNNSRFNSFFRLPQPIYELTVKGFYGKAVTYYLNLLTFNASVNTASGDFEIKCKFIGYQFAFLSDIMMNYVVALNNSKKGQQYLGDYIKKDNEKGLLSIPELLQKYTEIAKYTENFKKNDGEYELLKVFNTLQEKVLDLEKTVGISISNFPDNEFGSLINYSSLERGFGYLFLRDVGLFSEQVDGELANFEIVVNSKIDDINLIINQYKTKFPILNNFKLNPFPLTKSSSYKNIDDSLINTLKDIISANESGFVVDVYNTTFIQNKFNSITPVYYINFYSIRNSIKDQIKFITDNKIKYEEEIINKLNKSFTEKIGFNPTVFSVFEVLFGNVDIFLELIYEVCKKADSLGEIRVGNLKNYFSNNGNVLGFTDVSNADNRIYPFPAIYDLKGEYLWLGDVVGENNPNYPEIQLVNNIILGLVSDNIHINNDTNSTNFSENKTFKWVPINPIDLSSNILDNADNFNYGESTLTNLFDAVLSRAKILFEETLVSDSKFLKFAEIEAAYFSNNILNSNVKNFLSTISKDDFVNKGVEFFNLGSFSRQLGTYNFDTSNFLFFTNSEINERLRIFTNSILSTSVEQLILSRNSSIDNILYDGIIADFKYNKALCLNIDLTLCYDDSWTEKNIINEYNLLYGERKENIPYFSVVKNLKIIDGDISGVFLNDRNRSLFYTNNSHNKIGKSFTIYNNKLSLFDQFYYTENNEFGKALLFLQSLNFKDEFFLSQNIDDTASFVYVNNLYCAYIGGLFFRSEQYKNGKDIIVDDIKNNQNFHLIKDEVFFTDIVDYTLLYSSEYISFFIKHFLDFVEKSYKINGLDGLEFSAKKYVTLGSLAYRNIDEETLYLQSWEETFNEVKKIQSLIVTSPSKIYSSLSNAKIFENPTTYLTVFYNAMKNSLVNTVNSNNITEQKNNPQNNNSIINDKNVKIQIYNHLKVIYDKWLSYSTNDGKIYNFANYIKGGKTTKKLIDHCYFIDRTWSDIGNVAVLNPKPLLVYSNVIDTNVYMFMSKILKDNNFNVFNIPTYVNYYNKQDVADMFRPFNTIENSDGGACLIFQYVAGNSKILDLNERVGFFNDGFDFKRNNFIDIPKSLKERKIPSFAINPNISANDLKDYLAKYNLCVFRIAYADQNQNMFSKIEVSQEDHRETQESILIQNEIAGGKGGTKRLYMGSDLYNVYSLRSYKTTVESMGNMQIMPTQYFQLDNIPMFHGAHIIQNVRHNVTPQNVTTTFWGRRISRFTYPVIDKMTAYLNLELSEKLIEPQLTFAENEEAELSNGADYSVTTPEILTTLGFSDNLVLEAKNQNNSPSIAGVITTDRLVFTVIKNTTGAKFVLDDNINANLLNQRLSSVFKTNPADMDTYGAGAGMCATWVREALLRLGIAKIGNASTDAWNWFMGLPQDQKMFYFKNSDHFSDWTFEDLKNVGVPNGSLLFGYYNGSKYKSFAETKMKEFTNNKERIKILTDNKRITGPYDFTPITHIGIFYNDLFYEEIRGKISLSPNRSFVPVAAYDFLSTLKELVK